MRQKLKVNNDALKEKLAELYRRAAGFGPTKWNGESQLYGIIENGRITDFAFEDFHDRNSHAYGNNLVLLAICLWFEPLANENFDDWWENEGFSKEIPDWRVYAENYPEKWERKLDEWREIYIYNTVDEWVKKQIEALVDEAEIILEI